MLFFKNNRWNIFEELKNEILKEIKDKLNIEVYSFFIKSKNL